MTEKTMSLSAIRDELENKLTTIRCAGSAIRLALEPIGTSSEENARCEEALYSTAALLDYVCEDLNTLLHNIKNHTEEVRE